MPRKSLDDAVLDLAVRARRSASFSFLNLLDALPCALTTFTADLGAATVAFAALAALTAFAAVTAI